MSTVIYEFTAKHGTEDWALFPARMVDGTETSYAATTNDGEVQKLITNECVGSDLGAISKVELRFYGYGDDNDQCILRPVFGGTTDGDNHIVVPGASAGWKAWQDITNDTNAPDWSSWPHVQSLDCDVEYNKVSKGNTMWVGMAQIQVTYEPSGPTPGYYKLAYTSEPPTPNAWNQLKQEPGTGWKKLMFEGE